MDNRDDINVVCRNKDKHRHSNAKVDSKHSTTVLVAWILPMVYLAARMRCGPLKGQRYRRDDVRVDVISE
jgi:hypothetical protein